MQDRRPPYLAEVLAERDRLKASNAELLIFAQNILADATPGPHPRIFNTPEEIRQAATAIIAKATQKPTT